MERKLDGCFFRVERNGEWKNICFSDLTVAERDEVCKGWTAESYKRLAYHLADRLRWVGDVLEVSCE